MKKILLMTLSLCFTLGVFAQWKPAGDKIKTDWATQIDPANVLPEYPRPIMERGEWKNLNGLWNYAIIEKGQPVPATFDGEILVPFAVESSLSGVAKRMDDTKELVYQRSFEVPSAWKGKQVLLHFGAVDWKADVWVNDVKVGSHTGGYTPFSFDITAALVAKNNKLVVKVWDPTDKGYQPRGKQLSNPHGIWYTPVTGIWQTVWLILSKRKERQRAAHWRWLTFPTLLCLHLKTYLPARGSITTSCSTRREMSAFGAERQHLCICSA